MRRSSAIALALATAVAASMTSNAFAAAGAVVQTYPWTAAAFLDNPARHEMYATVPSLNSVAIIDTSTLAIKNTVFIGSNPNGMALSPDGSRLFVANSGSNFIGVLDTATQATLPSLTVLSPAWDLETGTNNRLFVLGGGGLTQIDATTGASAGPNLPVWAYGGSIEISPDKHTLYYGQTGLSPTSFDKVDVSNPASPTLLQEITTGSNGRAITLSHDGSMVVHPNGAPYAIAIYRTSDLLSLGTLNTGAYPSALAFSPDDKIAYAVHQSGSIDLFSTQTFLYSTSFHPLGEPTDLAVESSGHYLFSTYGGVSGGVGTQVFDTGRLVPEPASLALLSLASVPLLTTRRRRRQA